MDAGVGDEVLGLEFPIWGTSRLKEEKTFHVHGILVRYIIYLEHPPIPHPDD